MNSTSTGSSNSNSSVLSGGDGFGPGRFSAVSSAVNQTDQNLQISSWLINDMLTEVTKVCKASRLPTCQDDEKNMSFFGGGKKEGGSALGLALAMGASGSSTTYPMALAALGNGNGRGKGNNPFACNNNNPMNLALMMSMLSKDDKKGKSNNLLPMLLLQGRNPSDPNTMMLLALAKLKSCVDSLTSAVSGSGAATLMAIRPLGGTTHMTGSRATETAAAAGDATAAFANYQEWLKNGPNLPALATPTGLADAAHGTSLVKALGRLGLLNAMEWREGYDKENSEAEKLTLGGGSRRRKGACSNTKKKSSCSRRKRCNWSKGHKRRGSRKRVSGSCKKVASRRRSRSRGRR